MLGLSCKLLCVGVLTQSYGTILGRMNQATQAVAGLGPKGQSLQVVSWGRHPHPHSVPATMVDSVTSLTRLQVRCMGPGPSAQH